MGRSRQRVVASRGDLIVDTDPSLASGRLLRQGGMDASYIDLADPGHLEFDYMRWIRIVLRVARVRRVLHIGGGACALARALATEWPDGRQEVCEVDADVLAIARQHLGLRRGPGLHVRHAEGRAFVAGQCDRSWEAIVVDAFVGAAVPHRLITLQALTDVARVAPLALINVVDNRAARDVLATAAALTAVYRHVWTLGGRVGNTVVVGTERNLNLPLVSARTAADPSPARLVSAGALNRRLAGVAPLRDDELDSR